MQRTPPWHVSQCLPPRWRPEPAEVGCISPVCNCTYCWWAVNGVRAPGAARWRRPCPAGTLHSPRPPPLCSQSRVLARGIVTYGNVIRGHTFCIGLTATKKCKKFIIHFTCSLNAMLFYFDNKRILIKTFLRCR